MILVNGQLQQDLPATDRGLHYGDGLFETIAVRDGKPRLWERHIARLLKGCERLGIAGPDTAQLAEEAQQLCEGTADSVLKIMITRGSGGRGYRPPADAEPTRILFRYPWPEHADSGEPLQLRICKTPLGGNPALAGIKHLNRLEQVMARSEWQDESIAEGLMCDTQGNLIEGTMSNLFCVQEGRLMTPDLAQCGVEGIMRELVMAVAHNIGLPCLVTAIPVAALASMDEIFMTNSIMGIRPVARVDGFRYGDNPQTKRLQDALQTRLEEQ